MTQEGGSEAGNQQAADEQTRLLGGKTKSYTNGGQQQQQQDEENQLIGVVDISPVEQGRPPIPTDRLVRAVKKILREHERAAAGIPPDESAARPPTLQGCS